MKKYFTKRPILLFAFILFCLFSALLQIVYASITGLVIDAAVKLSLSQLKLALILIAFYGAAHYIVNVSRKNIANKLTSSFSSSLKYDLIAKITKDPFSNFNMAETSEYISLFNNDIKKIVTDYFDAYLNVFMLALMPLFSLIYIIYLNWKMAIIVLLISVIPLIIPLIFGTKMADLANKISHQEKSYLAALRDIFSGFEIVKCYRLENHVIKNVTDINTETEAKQYKLKKTEVNVAALATVFIFTSFIVMDIIGVYFIIKGQLTLGMLTIINQAANNVSNPLESLITYISKIKGCKLIKQKIFSYLSKENGETVYVKNEIENFDTLSINDLSFSYNNDNDKVLNQVNLEIKRGQKYAVVGTSGSGKSTLLKLIMQYFPGYNGEILYNSTDLKVIKRETLYEQMAMIHQNIFLFDDSIENNIALYSDASQEQIFQAIDMAGLTELVKSLKDGIQTHIKENGSNFSGGERQRIAIARALLRKTPVLLLDEATSSLDNVVAYDIENRIISMPDLTCMVITHRYEKSLLSKYDQIVVMKDGEIVESGTFSSLMDIKGYFYSLYNVGS